VAAGDESKGENPTGDLITGGVFLLRSKLYLTLTLQMHKLF